LKYLANNTTNMLSDVAGLQA